MIVRDADADLADVRWQAQKAPHTFYAVRTVVPGRATERAHRVIMARILGRPLERHEHVDHIDHDGLNNQRENLRLASHRENHCNRRPGISTSKHPGVSWYKPTGKWRACIRLKGKWTYLGYFASETEAADAYRRAAADIVREEFLP
jgi:hypothetical protein